MFRQIMKFAGVTFIFVALVGLVSSDAFALSPVFSDQDPNPQMDSCLSLTSTNLRYRSRDTLTNGEVSSLQDFLQSQNYLNSEPTGYFGLLTFKAVKDFQKDNGIEPTGYVGPMTRAMIKKISCNAPDNHIGISATITSDRQTTSVNPTIHGTAKGTGSVGVVLSNSGGKVYGSGLISVISGYWKVTVSPALTYGQYSVTVYDSNNNKLTSGTLNVVAGSGITVSLDPTSPVAQKIVTNQTTWLAKYKVTNNSNNPVTISQIIFHKKGTADDSVFKNSKLYDSNSNTVVASNPSSGAEGVITYSNLSISIPANGSNTISVDITPTLGIQTTQAGKTVALSIWSGSDISAYEYGGRTKVTGTFPITSALMTIVKPSNITPIVITDVQYSPAQPKVNDWITTTVTVQNRSTSNQSTPFQVNVQGTTANVYSLAAGAQTVVTVPNAFSFSNPGTYTLNTSIIYPNASDPSTGTAGDVYTNTLTFTASTNPTVTINSPNGGGYWYIGEEAAPITWTTTGVPSTATLDVIRLRSYDTGVEYNLAYNVPNTGGTKINIPSTIPVGAYTLEIKSYYNGTLLFDKSDSYFKVTTQPSASPYISSVWTNKSIYRVGDSITYYAKVVSSDGNPWVPQTGSDVMLIQAAPGQSFSNGANSMNYNSSSGYYEFKPLPITTSMKTGTWTMYVNAVKSGSILATSEKAYYSVLAQGDFNGDGVINSSDLQVFQGCLNLPVIDVCKTADFDGDNDVDNKDLYEFRSLYQPSVQ